MTFWPWASDTHTQFASIERKLDTVLAVLLKLLKEASMTDPIFHLETEIAQTVDVEESAIKAFESIEAELAMCRDHEARWDAEKLNALKEKLADTRIRLAKAVANTSGQPLPPEGSQEQPA